MADEALVLCLYAGGTIGMVQHPTSGYVPYPSFLTETLRTQARFHDPYANSVFSWSDSVDRYKAWSETYTRPPSGATSPSRPSSAFPVGENQAQARPESLTAKLQQAASAAASPAGSASKLPYADATPGYAPRHPQALAQPLSNAGAGPGPTSPPFGHSVLVRSSKPNGTSTHNATAVHTSPEGILELQLPTLLTPRGANGRRVRYAVLEYDPLLDSSEMEIADWIRLAGDIQLNYKSFDSFIVLHGTDTMAYTSSALSMLLENLGKSVILTGAQVPLSELRNDAIENMLGALMLSGSYIIPEVSLYFASTLYRGNRVSKVSNNAFSAFASPNMSTPLAQVGININVNWGIVRRPGSLRAFRAHDSMCPNVATLRLFPGLSSATVRAFLAPPLQGLVMESFGAGNAPSRPELLAVLKEATERGVVLVNITQCQQGEVSAIYAVGKKLEAVGVAAGGDMTPECALTKLSYLLGKPELSPARVRALMGRPLRGELTSHVEASGCAELGEDEDEEEEEKAKQEKHQKTAHPHRHPPPHHPSMSSLLARILDRGGPSFDGVDVSEAEPSQNGRENDTTTTATATATATATTAAAAWERSDHEVAAAERILLPYLIHRAASMDDVPSLESHLQALSHLSSSSLPSHTHAHALGPSTSLSPHASHSLPSPNPTSTLSTSNPLETLYPLHISSSLGHLASARLLLRFGASVHLRDEAGHTPLFLAARRGHTHLVELLKEAGAHLKEDEVEMARWLMAGAGAGAQGRLEAWRLAGLEPELVSGSGAV